MMVMKVKAQSNNQDEGVVDRYDNITAEVDKLTDECERQKQSQEDSNRIINQKINTWRTGMEDVIKQIGKDFASYFQRIECTGQVS